VSVGEGRSGDRASAPGGSGGQGGQGGKGGWSGLGRLVALVGEGAFDAELAALVWLLVEGNVPCVVASPALSASVHVRAALIDLLEPGTRIIRLAGRDEEFAWMPEASELGWRRNEGPRAGPPPGAIDRVTAGPTGTVMLADLDPGADDGLGDGPPTWGEHARVAIRALSIGYGMLAIAPGLRLEDVLSSLAASPVAALDDELTQLGLVLILAPPESGAIRVTAAHYLRPVSRDPEGHIRRFGPAVLAAWDPRMRRFEHFAWAITDELAGRLAMGTADLEREQEHRAELLRRLARESS
jgi:hypothetical protein